MYVSSVLQNLKGAKKEKMIGLWNIGLARGIMPVQRQPHKALVYVHGSLG